MNLPAESRSRPLTAGDSEFFGAFLGLPILLLRLALEEDDWADICAGVRSRFDGIGSEKTADGVAISLRDTRESKYIINARGPVGQGKAREIEVAIVGGGEGMRGIGSSAGLIGLDGPHLVAGKDWDRDMGWNVPVEPAVISVVAWPVGKSLLVLLPSRDCRVRSVTIRCCRMYV